MNATFHIRNAKKDDFAYIYESLQLVYQDLQQEEFLKKINIIFKKKKSWILVAENQFNKKIGFIISQNVNLINFKYQTLIITDFFINPKFRELKVADILYQELEQKAKENEFNEISVMCNINSTTTQNFYLKNKFKYNKKNYVKQI